MGWCGEKARAAGRDCASIYSLAKRLPAPRTELTGSTILPIGCALRRSEHVLSDKMTSNIACRATRFHHHNNRVLLSAGARAGLTSSTILPIG